MFWHWFKDDWLITRQAAKLFVIAAFLVLAVTPALLGRIDIKTMASSMRLAWNIVGALGSFALFFLWFGMWRFWVRVDNSRHWVKRVWFFVLLVGVWWGSCLYCFFIYLPQIHRPRKVEA
jgi:hypothetical protein